VPPRRAVAKIGVERLTTPGVALARKSFSSRGEQKKAEARRESLLSSAANMRRYTAILIAVMCGNSLAIGPSREPTRMVAKSLER
jgi:hypothetical protein